jgi:NADH-quinone oxidoreductase subunit L
MNHGLVLIPVLPGLAALLILVLGQRISLRGASILAVAASLASFLLSCAIAFQGLLSFAEPGLAGAGKAEVWTMGEFLRFGEEWKASLGFRMDRLSGLMSLLVTFAGTLILLFSIDYMREDKEPVRFFASVSLFISSMLILVLSENLVLLFLGWEGVGLCSYLLIGHYWREEGVPLAAYRAFFVNRVGDLFFILGVFFLLKALGTVSFSEMPEKFASMSASLDDHAKLDLTLASVLLLGGAFGKSAQVPLHVWLPDAMAGPTPVSALIHAATMVTAGVFLLARMDWLYAALPSARSIVLVAGLLTLVVGAVLACFQDDIKKVLAYSTLSHLGLMFTAVAAGSSSSGVFHLFGHASFKALSFLAAGSIILAAHHEQSLTLLRGVLRRLPVTRAAMWTGAIGGAGLLPFIAAGFYSKESILHSLHHAEGLVLPGAVIYWIVFCAELVGVVYLFRMMALLETGHSAHEAHASEAPGAHAESGPQDSHEIAERGIWLKSVLIVLVLAAFGFAVLSSPVSPLARLFFAEKDLPSVHLTDILIAAGSSLVVAVLAFLMFRKPGPEAVVRTIAGRGPVSALFYFDSVYSALILKPLEAASSLAFRFLETPVVAGSLRGAAAFAQGLSRSFSGLQSGLVNQYALIMILSAAVLIMLSLLV